MISEELVQCFYQFLEELGFRKVKPFPGESKKMVFAHYDVYFWIHSDKSYFYFGPEESTTTNELEFKYYIHEYPTYDAYNKGSIHVGKRTILDFRSKEAFDTLKEWLT